MHDLIKNSLIAIAIVVAAFASGFGGGNLARVGQEAKAGAFAPTGAGTYTLQTTISSTQSTITLTSFTEPVSNIPYTMSYLGSDVEYGTIAPTTGRSEFVSFTGITQNSDGTATLSGVTRGLSRTPGTTGCVASSTLANGWPSQTKFILGDSPCFFGEYAARRADQVITGLWRFDQYPTASSTVGYATSSWQLITYGQAAAIAAQGAATSTESIAGIVRLGTALQAASSTYIGALDPLVLQTKNATDTPQSGCATGYTSTAGAGCGVIALLTGKIKQSWLNLTDSFAFTSTVTIGATTTLQKSLIGCTQTLTDSATTTLDWDQCNTAVWNLGGNRGLAMKNLRAGVSMKLMICQTTGSNTVSAPNTATTTYRPATGFMPTLTTTAGKCDVWALWTATSSTDVFLAQTANF